MTVVVRGMVKRQQLPRHLAEEAEGYGMIGLCNAAERFDPAKGTKFTTYAAMRVVNAVKDGMRELDHLSRSHRTAVKRGQSEDVSVASLDAARFVSSGGREVNGHDLYGESGDTVRDDGFWAAATRGLCAAEREAIFGYFRDGLPMRLVGEKVGLSESRISQLVAGTIARLRKAPGLAERLGQQ